MEKNIALFIVFLLFSSVGMVFSDGFGIEMGWGIKNLENAGIEMSDMGDSYYELLSVPKPHPSFERYLVQIDPEKGVHLIKAVGKSIATNGFGTSLKTEFNIIEKQLTSVYGKGEKTDWLIPTSIWDEPEDWYMGLRKQERFLFTIWEQPSPTLLRIGVVANAFSYSAGRIIIEYYSKNHDVIKAKNLAAQSSSF